MPTNSKCCHKHSTMAAPRAPKQWLLTKNETITSYESWRQNLVYILSLDMNFVPFLDSAWQKKTAANPRRGFQDDAEPIPRDRRLTAAQKSAHLDLMLGQIANFCPVISRNSIVKNSTSLNDIWHKIRQHFGFQSTGAHFLDLANITLQPDERPEDLFQRLTAFFEDNLLTVNGGVSHHGEAVPADEDLTPTLENTIVVIWLQLIHPGLPLLVKQKYGAELRNQSIASLKPEISQALSSLLDELRCVEDTKAMRVRGYFRKDRPRQTRSCILCKSANRPFNTHNLVDCRFLPDRDKKLLSLARLVAEVDTSSPETALESDCEPDNESVAQAVSVDDPSALRVSIIQSPVLNCFFREHPVRLTLDTGATSNMVRASAARMYGFPITPASQIARQADGVTPMDVIGEVHCSVIRGDLTFELDALVVQQLDVDVLAGNPFMTKNDIGVRPAKRQIVINGSDVVNYGSTSRRFTQSSVRRTQAFLLRNTQRTVLLPGEYVQLPTPSDAEPDTLWTLEPRLDSPSNADRECEQAWPPPQDILSVGHSVRLVNSTDNPIMLKNGEQLCQVRHAFTPSVTTTSPTSMPSSTIHNTHSSSKPFSRGVTIDPDACLDSAVHVKFRALHAEFDDVFNPSISKYNGASGPIEAVVNMGPTLPPQRKGRLPQYNRSSLEELQAKFDELESMGVFAKPEQVNVQVEYLNTSFLVKKPNGGSRLVTSFGEVAQYSKPQPSLMPNVDGVLREIGRWKYLISTDLVKSFYQIPLAPASMKYCGVATPFKGVRVYTRSAMGMPGSETCLEELMSRILGDLIQEGCVAKIADDLYIGGQTPDEVLSNWRRVLTLLQNNNLRLSASKTIICPKTATVLGWIWSSGTLRASPHKLAALSAADPPSTVQGLRSFVGAYKVLSRVLPRYADLLDPLDKATAGRESREKLLWSEDLLSAFRTAQAALNNHRTITLPQPEDSLWIVTDGSVKNRGIAATLYIHRDGKLLLGGFFNAKLKKHQVTWLPCEIEALGIGTAVRHFSPYIIQSSKPSQVLTDSKPCVEAYHKLQRGEFSASSRVTTFLSVVSRYSVTVRHIAGVANLPSDFASRNPVDCSDSSCQICKFISETEDSVVRVTSVNDVLEESVRMPFTSRAAWLATQHECPDLRRVHSHLSQGTRPSKKATRIPDVKRYLKDVVIASDGLLVVRDTQPFQPPRERIVVPRTVVDGLLTALHIRFCHPSKYQTKRLFTRYFYALDVDKVNQTVASSCHFCQSVMSIPKHLQPQSSSEPPTSIGSYFAADVMRRYRQCVLILRETVSSFTAASLIASEKHDDLRNAILVMSADLRSLCDGGITIRVDSAPGFVALQKDPILLSHGIRLDIGQVKNVNKNPVAERAIEELGLEILQLSPEGGPISAVTLALAVSHMNSRIRRDGLSSREIWTQRDQLTGEQLPIVDRQIILCQDFSREHNHMASAKSKARGHTRSRSNMISVGDLVFLVGEKDKTKAREKYLVVRVDTDLSCQLRKFTSSQFRSKVYTVPMSQCYLVQPTVLAQSSQGPIRGQYSKPLDSDSDDDTGEPNHAIRGNLHAPPLQTLRPMYQPNFPCSTPTRVLAPPVASPPAPSPPDASPPVTTSPVPPPIPDAISAAPAPPNPVIETTSPVSQNPLRRSSRKHQIPFWQNDNWDLT